MFFGFFFCLTIAINKHVRIQKIFPGWGGGFARLFELYREGGGVWGIFLKNLNKRGGGGSAQEEVLDSPIGHVKKLKKI